MNQPDYYTEKNAHKKVTAKRFFLRKFQPFFLRTQTKFFSLYIFWSRQHLANSTNQPCHQTSSFGHPTHPPLWWLNTWMVPYANRKRKDHKRIWMQCMMKNYTHEPTHRREPFLIFPANFWVPTIFSNFDHNC